MSDSNNMDSGRAGRIDRIVHWLTEASSDGTDVEQIQEVHRLFLEELATRAGGVVNRRLSELSYDTLDKKSELCSELNAFLASLDLGVRSWKTGLVGIISADASDNSPVGRFRLLCNDSSGARHTTETFTYLPPRGRPLVLAPRSPQGLRRPATEFFRRDGDQSGRAR